MARQVTVDLPIPPECLHDDEESYSYSYSYGLYGPCSQEDGCAGCTTDGNGDSVTGSDCEWKVFDDGHSECFRTDDSTHCQTGPPDGPPESAKSNFVDSFILKFQSDFDRLTFGWANSGCTNVC